MALPLADSLEVRHIPVIIILLVGVSLVGYGAYNYQQQSTALEHTVEVNATVAETDIATDVRRGNRDFIPEVTFEYRYQNTSYTSDNIYPAGSGSNYNKESKARDVVQEYEEGTTVTAYVNPSSPDSAFLENEKSDKPLTLVGIGTITLLVAGRHIFKSSQES
ncbi:DUF3592 domain-containing protein [Halorussus amylolyticus]|uniref:DUF3592 domain-containing protein n=1 Tax=Halorussus amylolyticus TaxID=1126242 RepID=UPI00104509BC|nr:DUF3592 domain-containing protein [Halorussus amylolyticus]